MGSGSLGLSIDEVLTTTRTVRRRLDLDRPVPFELVEECLDLALQAPNGSARQEWHFVVVGDPERKRALAELYRRCLDDVHAAGLPTLQFPGDERRTAQAARILSSAGHLATHLERVPWMVLPCQERRLRGADVRAQAGWWGSILPAVWSFMLAARGRGLGTAWTTVHLAREQEAADVLGIPYESVVQAALVPVAYTVGTQFAPADRLPLQRVLHVDAW